jgi:molecular chaperone IbpA
MDMRAAYDFAPLYRSLIGADHMATLVENALQGGEGRDYPPYDVEKTSEDGYRISLAVAGFGAADLEVTSQPNMLVVRGRKSGEPRNAAFVHQGLALRPFERRFELADHVVVTDAQYAHGLLTIDLVREVPETLKPRRIEINTTGVSPLTRLLERKRRPAKAA